MTFVHPSHQCACGSGLHESDCRCTVEDLDPHRTVTHLEDGVPHCYLGHSECYDAHASERLADEADWAEELL